MIILDTVTHETIWGGQKLIPYSDGSSQKIGHLYSLCCEKGLENRIRNGRYKGKVFQEYFEENKEKFGLDHYEEFPLIIALVEANDHLSIQVHPDDVVAAKYEGAAYGKNESWYFLDAPGNGKIFNGCLADSKDTVQKKMEDNKLMDLVDSLEVQAGDYVYVEAGTLHALSKGSFLYEIEENSPWTYRMYDFDRVDADGNKRELHIDKAVRALKPELKSKAVPFEDTVMEERRYTVSRIIDRKSYRNESDTLECVTMIKGSCTAEGSTVGTGTTVVLEPGEVLEGNLKLAVMARPK